ncbi:hypothetical protein DNK47_02885 [Mycoplasma wenyonii]|uniref:Uncharacterized protein n=1 Tax=Mycoplasma wenyonii TaxID=65123 RepID=A0A328PID9_9MOLU|nr:hypothetical protein [Mycoplasma wenyonii]RAO94833.1 hypothetical protein DNK47_02885 [Mycoplasma wenyonii]
MNPLGYCLSIIPVVAGCGYGVYALTRGGQSVANVADLPQAQISDQVTQERNSLEASNFRSTDKVTRREKTRGTIGDSQQHRTRKSSNFRKSLSDFNWTFGRERSGGKELLVQITKGTGAEEQENLKFGSGFTVSADGQDLSASYILCTVNSNSNKYFLMKREGSSTNYTTINGDRMPPCSWRNSPKENVTKYSIFKWDESGQKSNPIKNIMQIDLSTCTINGKNWNSNTKRLEMICKESANSMFRGRPSNSDISIELKKD